MKETTKSGQSATADEPAINRYTADAQDRVNRLRALSADFPEGGDPTPLTSGEIRLVTMTSAEALEQAAVMAMTAVNVGGALSNVDELRDAINYIFAYQQVRGEAESFVGQLELSIIRRKLRAVKAARALYQVMKAYAKSEAGAAMLPYVKKMGEILKTGRRRKAAALPEPVKKE